MEPNWLHIKAHQKAVCVLVRLLRKRNKGRSKETFTNPRGFVLCWFGVFISDHFQILFLPGPGTGVEIKHHRLFSSSYHISASQLQAFGREHNALLEPEATTALYNTAEAQKRKRTKNLPREFILLLCDPARQELAGSSRAPGGRRTKGLRRKVAASTGCRKPTALLLLHPARSPLHLPACLP